MGQTKQDFIQWQIENEEPLEYHIPTTTKDYMLGDAVDELMLEDPEQDLDELYDPDCDKGCCSPDQNPELRKRLKV